MRTRLNGSDKLSEWIEAKALENRSRQRNHRDHAKQHRKLLNAERHGAIQNFSEPKWALETTYRHQTRFLSPKDARENFARKRLAPLGIATLGTIGPAVTITSNDRFVGTKRPLTPIDGSERARLRNRRNAFDVIDHRIGRILTLTTYPIKALAPVDHASIAVEQSGLTGDRVRALFVETPDHRRCGKTLRGKENSLLHTAHDLAAGSALAKRGGATVVLSERARYFDAAPLSIIIDTWVADCERLAGVPIEPQRFRPNIFVRSEVGFALTEAELIGMTILIGEVKLRVVDSITRCVTPAYDLRTGETDPAILRAIANDRKNIVGIYAEVIRTGPIAVGDALRSAE